MNKNKTYWRVYEVANTEEEQPIAWECPWCGEIVGCEYNYCPRCGEDMSLDGERKAGRWIDPTPENGMVYDKKAYAECSVCGQKEYLGRGKKYCPNCGAWMVRGEEHD